MVRPLSVWTSRQAPVGGDKPEPIQLDRLPERLGSLTAVDDIVLDAAAGTAVGVLGPNVAGRTTTMRRPTDLQPTSCRHLDHIMLP
ncbi:hypothetical protein AB0H43_22045 [Hamadaea sp. NPDC050747]|uniref:hypothetical protein n=1 Tax=Hamadaea sp. NPDC050747 TaxID=3155789 RepID=UPI0033E30879